MDSFKRNLILLATYIIVISYVITPGNTDVGVCNEDLTSEHFNTNSEFDSEYIDLIQKPIEKFYRPHTKVFHKLINYYRALMCPMIFCLWIYSNDAVVYPKILMIYYLDINQVWQSLLEELHTYTYCNICLTDLSNDHYNIVEHGDQNLMRSQHPIETFTTPYGKAYHKVMKFYGDMHPIYFCSWLNADVNLNSSKIKWKINIDPLHIWRKIVQELTTYTYIINTDVIKCPNILSHLCVLDLKFDGFNTDLVDDNGQNVELLQTPNVIFNTPHSLAYSVLFNNYATNVVPNIFCSWLYGFNDQTPIWYTIRSKIAYDTCINELFNDNFNVSDEFNAEINRMTLTPSRIENINNWLSMEYINILFHTGVPEEEKNSKMFCVNYSIRYVSLLKQYYGTPD